MKPTQKVNHKDGFFLTNYSNFRSINISYFSIEAGVFLPAFVVSIFSLAIFKHNPQKAPLVSTLVSVLVSDQ